MVSPLSTPAGGSTATFCAAKNLLMTHLPNASMLTYTQGAAAGAVPSIVAGSTYTFNWEEDIGTMPVPGGNGEIVCAPYSPPAALPEATHKAEMTLTTSGSVSDCTPTYKGEIAVKIGAALGVDTRRAFVTCAAGSLVITLTVNYTSAENAEAGSTQLNTLLSDVSDASYFLSSSEVSMTVTVVQPAYAGSVEGGLATGALIGIIAAAAAVVLVLLLCICMMCQRKKEGKPIFVCLDDVKEDKKAAPRPAGTAA